MTTPPLEPAADGTPAPVVGTGGPGGRTRGVVSGTRWLSFSQVVVQLVRMGVHVLLARVLAPEDFGLLAMALVITSFLDVFRDLGTRSAIVQKAEVSPGFLSGMFVVNISIGAALSAGVALSAPLVAALYGQADLTQVLRVLGLSIVVASFGLVQQGTLQRDLRFGRLATTQLASAAAQAAVSLSLAAAGYGVWALVLGVVASAAGTTVTSWLLSPWRPVAHCEWREVRSVWGFSLNLSGAQLASFFVTNADKFIIGRALGASPLGYYSLAQRMVIYPVRSLTQVLQSVLFPAFSRVQHDDAAIRRGYLRACGAIALVVFPAMAGIAVVAGPFVHAVLGSEWTPAVPIIAILAPISGLQALNYTIGILYQAKGRTDLQFRWSLLAGAVTVVAYLVGVRWGIVGVTVSFAISILVLTPLSYIIPFRLIDLRWRDFLTALAPYASATAVMVAGVWSVQRSLARALSPGGSLVTSVAIGVAIYGVFLLVWRPPGLIELRLLLGLRGSGPRAGAPRGRRASVGLDGR